MYAMQYEIELPAGYDIEHRVATRGHRTDAFPGLGLKAYLVRDNHYAPFYLWTDTAGMSRFLWGGGGFEGIVQDFGRPPVHHWTVARCLAGPARASAAKFATKRVGQFVDDLDRELAELAQLSRNPSVHTTALAIDPRRWEVVRFTLWTTAPAEDTDVQYRVLHLSRPNLDQLN
ncbi:DUF4865 family protein [Amycolatopsis orientalis]|uniref:DUF4865 family protein n=1 Tax=Amycolatopsis orientalis TaxID=31958 RepID=UPI0003A1F286|nr:DUF4865 family protein [Amycolatopsis orientalis]